MTKHYSTKEVSQELDISEQTVRLWSKTFDIPYTKSSGNIRFETDAVEMFELIKNLRNDNSGFDTIRRQIDKTRPVEVAIETPNNDPSSIPTQSTAVSTEATTPSAAALDMVEFAKTLERVLGESVKQNISEHSELAERYARATYRIGELESTLKFMNEKLEQLEDDKADLKQQQQQLHKQQQQAQEKHQEIVKQLTKPVVVEPVAEAPKGFWEKLFGK